MASSRSAASGRRATATASQSRATPSQSWPSRTRNVAFVDTSSPSEKCASSDAPHGSAVARQGTLSSGPVARAAPRRGAWTRVARPPGAAWTHSLTARIRSSRVDRTDTAHRRTLDSCARRRRAPGSSAAQLATCCRHVSARRRDVAASSTFVAPARCTRGATAASSAATSASSAAPARARLAVAAAPAASAAAAAAGRNDRGGGASVTTENRCAPSRAPSTRPTDAPRSCSTNRGASSLSSVKQKSWRSSTASTT